MLVSLDVSLDDPSKTIDIIKIVDSIKNNPEYQILTYSSENFVSFQKYMGEHQFRIHKDGRIYVKKKYLIPQKSIVKNNLLNLFEDLKDILENLSHLIKRTDLRSEINFNFVGEDSDCFFWAGYPQVKKIGRTLFRGYEIRTYRSSNDVLSVKVESSNL